MRTTHRCPKCRHYEVLHLSEVRDRVSGEHHQPLSLAEKTTTHRDPILPFSFTRTRIIGQVEAYVCRACGYTELYTQNPSEIEVGEGIELLQAKPVTYREEG